MVTIAWTFTVLLALAFIGAGLATLAARDTSVLQLRTLGYPLWCGCVAGAIALVTGLLVLLPRFAPVAAGVLACLMAGVASADVVTGRSAAAVAPSVLLVLALAVGSLRGWGRPDPFAWSAAIDRQTPGSRNS